MNAVASSGKMDWRALLVGMLMVLSAGSLLGLAPLTALAAIFNPGADHRTTLTLLLLAGGMFFIGLLLLPGAYLNGRKVFGLPDVQVSLPHIENRILYLALFLGWILTLALGQIASISALSDIILPILNWLAIGLPVSFLVCISLSGLKLPPARQAWSVFGVSLISGPVLALIFETIALLGIFLVFMLYAMSNPELSSAFQQISKAIQFPEAVTLSDEMSAKILFAPGTVLAIFSLFSVAVPIIEETVKMAALLLYADRIRYPREGFILGILSGAAFALAENAGFSSVGADDWAFTVITRASSALPHILNCGILGWALVSAWKERKYLQLGLAYIAVILIHGTWNAISALMAYNSLAALTPQNLYYIASPLPASAGWMVMIFGTFFGLSVANRQVRRLAENEQIPEVVYNLPLS